MSRSSKASLELQMYWALRASGFPDPVCSFVGDGKQHRFHHRRRWALDFAWPEDKIALEVQGGIWKAKGHGSGAQFRLDRVKSAAAQMLGWIYLEVTTDMIRDGTAVELLGQAFNARDRFRRSVLKF